MRSRIRRFILLSKANAMPETTPRPEDGPKSRGFSLANRYHPSVAKPPGGVLLQPTTAPCSVTPQIYNRTWPGKINRDRLHRFASYAFSICCGIVTDWHPSQMALLLLTQSTKGIIHATNEEAVAWSCLGGSCRRSVPDLLLSDRLSLTVDEIAWSLE